MINLHQTQEDCFEAVVRGSEMYNVKVTMEDIQITKFSCDCPFDYGPVCKHVVAVLYAIRELKPGSGKKQKKPEILKKITVRAPADPTKKKFETLLHQADKDELAVWLMDWANNDVKFRELFIARFSPPDNKINVLKYARILEHESKPHSSHYRNDDFAVDFPDLDVAEQLLEKIRMNFPETPVSDIISFCFAIFEVVAPSLNYVDDYDGDYSGLIEDAMELLDVTIQQREIPDSIRKELLSLCLEKYNIDGMETDCWDLGVLELAGTLVENASDKTRLFNILDKLEKEDAGNYQTTRIVGIRREIIGRTEGEKSAQKYAEAMIHLPEIRSEFIEKAIKAKNYYTAKDLCEQGLKLDAGMRGIVNRWNEFLLTIAQKEKDIAEILRLATLMFFETFSYNQYYPILKQYTPAANWLDTVEKLIQKLIRDRNNNSVPWIFIQEKMYDRLLAYVQSNAYPSVISEYDKYLLPHYPAEIADLYEKTIRNLAKHASTRKDYAECCRWLRRLKKGGKTDRSTALLKEIAAANPRKPAFLDELAKV